LAGQAVEQGVDARARRAQAGPEGITLGAKRLHLAVEQGVGALEFFVSHQQALNALGDLLGGGQGLHNATL
jgi:hypothetical protein